MTRKAYLGKSETAPSRSTSVMSYVWVDGVKASLGAEVATGGKALVGPIGLGIFGRTSDPDGNILGLWKEKPPAKPE